MFLLDASGVSCASERNEHLLDVTLVSLMQQLLCYELWHAHLL